MEAGNASKLWGRVGEREAFGWPGLEPKWTAGAKEGIGTAYSSDSKVWFTLWRGIITEVYYPTVDRPQIRDMQYLTSDGENFFHEEKRHLVPTVHRLSHHALGYRIVNSDPMGRYSIRKEVIADPHLSCVLVNTKLEGEKEFLSALDLYVLCAPHLGGGGMGNNAFVIEFDGRRILAAEKGGIWLALGATVPFTRLSCGYVGRSDGWTDISKDMRMDWEFDRALDGNVALTGKLDIRSREFTLGLTFGSSLHNAMSALLQSLAIPFQESRKRFMLQWERPYEKLLRRPDRPRETSNLYHSSYSLLLSHEDKSFPGAFIASLSIPWGEKKGDEEKGGYHLVWTRDLVHTASSLLANGDLQTPLRALIYLAVTQKEDGGFAQNYWIGGEPYWGGMQLDETAFPVLLAYQLRRLRALKNFDPFPMVIRAARHLVQRGPVTEQERWEEVSGYSPSTLATNIAALICAAQFARERGEEQSACYLEDYADFLESHVEDWTVTTQGTLLPGVRRHYIRIRPARVDDPCPEEDPDSGVISISNKPPGERKVFPAKEIVDAGFLELVRYGIRRPDDPIVLDSLLVVDAVLKVETPMGPCWHRYNNDGYGQREDGSSYEGHGIGRAWPLLTGERGHYEIAAGHDPGPYLRAMEGFASSGGLLPEQVWDEPDNERAHMRFGGPTGSAMPLMWAHGEYLKLVRSAHDRRVFDYIPEVGERYIRDRSRCKKLEIWKPNRRVKTVKEGHLLRIQAEQAFSLHWSTDDWVTAKDTQSTPTSLGVEYVDLDGFATGDLVKFTFLWLGATEWEGRNCEVSVVAQEPRPREHDQLAAEVVPQEARQSTRSLPPSTWGR